MLEVVVAVVLLGVEAEAAVVLFPSCAKAVFIGVVAELGIAKKPLPASSIEVIMNTPVPLIKAIKGFLRFPLLLLIDIVRLDNDYYLRD